MIFDKEGTTTIVFQEKASLATFIQKMQNAYPNLEHDNIILNLFSFDKLTSNDVLEFLEFSRKHKSKGKSFVLVTTKISYDEVHDEISLVPTVQEAKDLIEMEEIERDLEL